MSKRVYISADYDPDSGDRNVVAELDKWCESQRHNIEFTDMAKVVSGSVAKGSDCRICDLKAEFNTQINLSSAVIFVIGDKTASRTAGSKCDRLHKQWNESYCTPYKQNANGSKICKHFYTHDMPADGDVGNINTYSYLRHEFEQAKKKGKAKCFAGDVGSIGIAFIMLFLIGKVIIVTRDLSYLIFLLVYGVDGVLTICHQIMLHENLGEAHRKHAYQLMCNELKIGHVKVSLLYMAIQLLVSLGFIYVCPNNIFCHWMYMIGALVVLAVAYVLFKKKYYHLHEEYLASLKK